MSVRAHIWLAASIAVVFAFMSAGSVEAKAVGEGQVLAHEPAAVINGVLSAWSRSDAHAIAANYEPDGDFVSPTGERALGRIAIEAFYKAAFKMGYAGSVATATAVHVRALSATFTLVDGRWTIQPTTASKITEPESGLFCAVLRWRAGRWWISALREQTSAKELRDLNVRSGANRPGHPMSATGRSAKANSSMVERADPQRNIAIWLAF